MHVKAVLFDMDGVIVDSMPYHFIAWYEALRPLGIRVSCFYVLSKEGERWEKTLNDLLRSAGKKLSSRGKAAVFARKQRIFRKYFKRSVFGGAEELLAGLKRDGVKLALVTGTPLPEVRHILPRRLFAMFDAVVTGDMVAHGKPHPDPYLTAAARLGVRPGDCFVVENAPLGIRSAKAAGMYCCVLTTSLPAEYLAGSDETADSLADAGRTIRRFLK